MFKKMFLAVIIFGTVLAALLATILFVDSYRSDQHADRSLYIVSTEFPPYYGSSLENNGFISEIIQAAFLRARYTVSVDFLPWDKAVEKTKAGIYDALYTMWRTPEREEDFIFAIPFFPNELVFFQLSEEEPVEFTDFESLSGVRIGAVESYTYTSEFWEADLDLSLSKIELDIFSKLTNKEVDVVIADRIVGWDLIRTYYPEYEDKIAVIDTKITSLDQHVVFPKILKGSAQLQNDFNEALRSMQSDGTFAAILSKYNVKY